MDSRSHIFSVRTLVGEMRQLLETSYRNIWVEGEVSNLAKPASGHLYFSLKEKDALVRCAFFRNRRSGQQVPKEGMQVLVRGQISIYPGRGDLQLIVNHLEEAGEGALRRAFEQLKKKLSAEGLFDTSKKKPLPPWPQSIGIISSPGAAALQDMLVTLRRRFPMAHVIVYPALVQGAQAADSLCDMLQTASHRNEVDVLLLARGGGSLEDLQPFNEERVARAIAACPLPLVSGVGHETDFTIADMVADQRGATPTAAAELVAPDSRDLAAAFSSSRDRLIRNIIRNINIIRQHIDFSTSKLVHPALRLERLGQQRSDHVNRIMRAVDNRMLLRNLHVRRQKERLYNHSPVTRLEQYHYRVNDQQQKLRQHIGYFLSRHSSALTHRRNTLQITSPTHTLNRGYAILQNDSGEVVTSKKTVSDRQPLLATVADGEFRVKVSK